MDQSARTAALDQFRKNEVTLLVASDVAARGLDIPAVSHIFNFDVPHHPDDYVHRIGRTGRAGRTGTAITVVAPSDTKSVAAIEKLIGQSIPWMGGEPRVSAPERSEADGPGSADQRNGEAGTASAATAAPETTSSETTVNSERAVAAGMDADRRPDAIAFRRQLPVWTTCGRAARPSRRPKPPMPTTAGICRPFCCVRSKSKPEHIRAEFAAAD